MSTLRLQAVLVATLVLGSLAAMVFNVFAAIVPRERELQVREELRTTSRRMASAVELESNLLMTTEGHRRDEVDRVLASISEHAMASYPNVEGGFYLAGESDRFSGFAQGNGKARPPHLRSRNEPPPLESPLIRVQAQQCLGLPPGEFLLNIRDVGPSRVAVLTEPVGTARPARLATWVMFRLVDPKELGTQVRRYQLSTGLALGGLASAVVLAWNMNRLINRQNRERDQLQRELRRSEHLASLGTMLSGVAHEVRNPLAAIRSTVQLWKRLPDTVHNPNAITAIIAAVDRINQIVSQLLQFSRTGGDARELVDVHQLLGETLDLIAAQAESQGVTIARCFESRCATVNGSAQALRQVYLNLTSNALQAMSTGGILKCRTEDSNGMIAITFADSGAGVSAEDQKHLFEPFFTTRSEGTGLGLAICREIITQHGGAIKLVSEAGPGATFCVTLPITSGEGPGEKTRM